MATIADLVIKLSANTASAEKDITTFSGKVSKGFGRALLPAVGVLGGLAVGARKAADAASNLGESQNAVKVVFGDSSKIISDFAKVADKEAGLSMRSLNELVTPIGASLINMGDSADVAATKSVALARRAADMASVFNVDVKDALGAIQAGLRGEADPLERFGVGLSDAAVSAKAMSMGLAKTTAELTPSMKAQARYALLMDQTNKLQGDFVNTSDSAANAARINAAQQENLTATLGKGLLPVVETYQKLLSSLTGFMAEHTTAVKVGALALGGLAAAVVAVNLVTMLYTTGAKAARLATIAWTAVQWLLNAALSANPIGIVIMALVALAAAIVVAWKRSETFRRIVTTAWNAIRGATTAVFNFIRAHIKTIMAAIFVIMTGGLGAVVLLVYKNWSRIKEATSTAWGFVKGVVKGAVGVVRAAAGAIAAAFQPVLDVFARIISMAGAAAGAIDRVLGLAGKVGGALGKIGGLAGKIPGFASGTSYFGGGLAVVGERGPELVNLPRGSQVFSNGESRGMGHNGPLIGEVHVNGETDIELLAGRVQRRLAFDR